MPGTHRLRSMYSLLVRLERLKEQNKVAEYEPFFEVCVVSTKAIIELIQNKVEASRPLTKATERRVEKLYLEGYSNIAIAKLCGIGTRQVWQISRKRGLFKKARSKPLPLFSHIPTPTQE